MSLKLPDHHTPSTAMLAMVSWPPPACDEAPGMTSSSDSERQYSLFFLYFFQWHIRLKHGS